MCLRTFFLVCSLVPAAFEHPNDFIPERWYSRPELIHDERAFAPFSVGSCSPPSLSP